jgi:hypothetical protein
MAHYIDDSLSLAYTTIPGFTANGTIPATTLDAFSVINVPQAVAGLIINLAPPTANTTGMIVRICNTGNARFTIGTTNVVIAPQSYKEFQWNGGTWVASDDNTIGWRDTRSTNENPQDYNGGIFWEFKQTSAIGLAVVNAPLYTGLLTFRRYANQADFSGGPIKQEARLDDGRIYYRYSTSATTWGAWNLQGAESKHLQTKLLVNGAIKHSVNREVRWTNQLRTMTNGSWALGEVSGYHDITFPSDGTTISVQGSTPRTIVAGTNDVATGGVLLNVWESLWYKIVDGTNNASVPANFLITPYSTANTNVLTDEWVLICSRDDSDKVKWFNGDVTEPGAQFGGSLAHTQNIWGMIRGNMQGDGYYFSPGGNTAIPTVFGFSGSIRGIMGGTSSHIASTGYIDITQTFKTVGTPIIGLGGSANKTWRLMTAVEKPSWFGGATATYTVNRIDPATTTVVDLTNYETLYYVVSVDKVGNAQGTWVVANYSYSGIPAHWIPIAKQQQGAYTNNTLQVLIGRSNITLKAGDAKFMHNHEHAIDMLHRNKGITHKGIKHCRWTPAGYFSGTGANGLIAGADGLMINWEDNSLIFGISDGYASWGTQYAYINVPAVGTQIPVAMVNSNITRVVADIGGTRFIPLGTWEALYYIPGAYQGGTSSNGSEFIIANYNGNSLVPSGAIMVAKHECALTSFSGSSTAKNRVKFADGTYFQAGRNRPASVAVQAMYDLSHGSAQWRNVTVAGSTPPGGSAIVPAIVGVQGNYGAPYTMQYRQIFLDDDPRGSLEIKGLIQLNANITDNTPIIAFIPGCSVYGNPILTVSIMASTLGDNKMIPAQVRFSNTIIGNQEGVIIQAYLNSFNTASNPYFTLGVNGGASPAGIPQWVSFDNIRLPMA